MLSCPPINTSVTVDVAGWREPWRTRVEDLTDEILVAAPVDEAEDHEPSLGAELTLAWDGDRGPVEVTVTLAAKELERVPMWRLRPTGPVVITQRRHHVRVPTLAEMTLLLGEGAVSVHLVDLSEGGFRAVCPGSARVDVGDRPHVGFEVERQEFVLPSEVVRADRHDGRLFLGCRFVGLHPTDGDRIRRVVFSTQARHQRLRS